MSILAGGGGLGGPTTIADGANVTQGSKADAAWNGTAGSASLVALLKAIWAGVSGPLPAGSVVALNGANFLPSAKSPVTGTFTATGQSASFAPLAGRNFNVSLWGTFAGAVQLERSFDAGTTWLPITAAGTQLFAFTGPASELREGEHEAGVLYRLNCTAFTSGTINFRVSQ